MMIFPHNIFLIGLMGAGKTTIGRSLARLTHKHFYDADQELEARTGVRIPIIFEIEGEVGFRRREKNIIAILAQKQNIVLATGGGAVLRESNRQVLKAHGLIVYLYANLEDLWTRTKGDKNRPLLQTDHPKQRLATLFAERHPLYQDIADIVIDTTGQHVHAIAHLLWEKLKTHYENS
jgi:shikimate kinase